MSSVNGCTLCIGRNSWAPCSARSWLISAVIHIALPFLLGSLVVEGSRYAIAPASAGGASASNAKAFSPISLELVASAPVPEQPVVPSEPQEAPPLEAPKDVEPPPKVDDIVKPLVKKKPSVKPKVVQPTKKVTAKEPPQVAQNSAVLPSAPSTTTPDAPSAGLAQQQPGVGSGESTTAASPDYLRNPPPAYPRESRYNKEEGTVLLAVELDGDGVVSQISLRKSSNFSRLDEAALAAVRRWKFKPARVAGVGVSSSIVVPVKFVLD